MSLLLTFGTPALNIYHVPSKYLFSSFRHKQGPGLSRRLKSRRHSCSQEMILESTDFFFPPDKGIAMLIFEFVQGSRAPHLHILKKGSAWIISRISTRMITSSDEKSLGIAKSCHRNIQFLGSCQEYCRWKEGETLEEIQLSWCGIH